MNKKYNNLPKIIWMLWLQGEKEAPYLVQKCIALWKRHHPDWQIKVLDKKSATDYCTIDITNPHLQKLPDNHLSDLIKLDLLRKYGGVWADATLYCNKSLDDWLDAYMESGFFCFRNPGKDRLCSSWFLASVPEHFIVTQWKKKSIEFVDELAPSSLSLLHKIHHRVYNKLIQHSLINASTTLWYFSRLNTRLFRVRPYFFMHYCFNWLLYNNKIQCRH